MQTFSYKMQTFFCDSEKSLQKSSILQSVDSKICYFFTPVYCSVVRVVIVVVLSPLFVVSATVVIVRVTSHDCAKRAIHMGII